MNQLISNFESQFSVEALLMWTSRSLIWFLSVYVVPPNIPLPDYMHGNKVFVGDGDEVYS